MAGQTKDSETLQGALGFARVFYNISMLMTMLGMGNYFNTVVPGAIGAGRKESEYTQWEARGAGQENGLGTDREHPTGLPKYAVRSISYILLLCIPVFILQWFSEPIMVRLGVLPEMAAMVGVCKC